jgi:hypothetical protein
MRVLAGSQSAQGYEKISEDLNRERGVLIKKPDLRESSKLIGIIDKLNSLGRK